MTVEKKDIDWGSLGFGYMKTDYSYEAHWKDGEWDEGGLTTDHTLHVSECGGIFHYCQEVFEGLKAYTAEDGSIVCFRPDMNAERMYNSAQRLEMPPFPKDKFVEAVKQVVSANAAWVPPFGSGATLYVRPFMIGSGDVIGVAPAPEYTFRILVTPVGPYFKGGLKPVKLRVSEYDRAAPHGTGNIKAGLNYAMSLKPTMEAHREGYAENLYLDSESRTYVEETGGANVLFVKEDGTLVVPRSHTDSILPSITRRSLVQVAQDLGMTVDQRPVEWAEVKAGTFVECGLCGTAAVISPVGEIDNKVYGADETVTFPAGYTEIGFLRLARSVDHAAHDGDRDGLLAVGQRLLDLVCQSDEVDARPPAGGAGDDVDAVPAQPGGLQNVLRRQHLLHRVGGQRYAHRIADALTQKGADAHSGFDGAHALGARFGHADVQRVVRTLGKQPVRLDHQRDGAGFHRHADIMKIVFLQQRNMSERAFYQRLRRGVAVFFQKTRFQTAAVHADTDGDAPRAAGLDHGPHPVLPADVAGVDADLGRAVFRRADGKAVVKVDIRHQRQRGRGADGAEGLRGLHVRNGQPRDLAPGGSQRADLRKAAVHVGRSRVQHRLDGYRRASADRNAADHNFSCEFSLHFYRTSFQISLNVINAMKASSRIMPAAWI